MRLPKRAPWAPALWLAGWCLLAGVCASAQDETSQLNTKKLGALDAPRCSGNKLSGTLCPSTNESVASFTKATTATPTHPPTATHRPISNHIATHHTIQTTALPKKHTTAHHEKHTTAHHQPTTTHHTTALPKKRTTAHHKKHTTTHHGKHTTAHPTTAHHKKHTTSHHRPTTSSHPPTSHHKKHTTSHPTTSTSTHPTTSHHKEHTTPHPTTAHHLTNHTTAPATLPTTHPHHTVVPPPTQTPGVLVGDYVVKNGSAVCLRAQAGLQLQVRYTNRGKQQLWGAFAVPPNSTNASGSCSAKTATLNLRFPEGFLFFTFQKNETQNTFYLSRVRANLTDQFLQATETSFAADNASFHEFGARLGHSYQCKNRSLVLSEGFRLNALNERIQAFGLQGGAFGDAEVCPEQRRSNVLPITVGVVLVILISIVVVAFAVGRWRTHQGYQTL